MKWKKRLTVIASVAFVCLVACIITAGFFFIEGYFPSTTPQVAKASVIPENNEVLKQPKVSSIVNEDKLVDWVMRHSWRISRKTAREIVELSFKTSRPLLMLALMARESNFSPTAMSRAGALGITQVRPTPENVKYLVEICKLPVSEKRDLFDLEISIMAGDCMLKHHIEIVRKSMKRRHESYSELDLVRSALCYYRGGKDKGYVKDIFRYLGELSLLCFNKASVGG